MAECPKCSTSLPDDFGMVACSSCRAMVFLDMDGQPHMSEEEPDPPESEESPAPVALEGDSPAVENELPSDSEAGLDGALSFDQLPDIGESANSDSLQPSSFEEFMMSDEELAGEEEEELPTDSGLEDFSYSDEDANSEVVMTTNSSDDSAEEEESPAEFVVSEEESEGLETLESQFETQDTLDESPGIEDLSDIADFGNSEISQGKEGVIYYDLVIEGIDTMELRAEIKASVEDSRFNWNIQDLLSRIENGRLEIEMVSPAKAVLVVKTLKGLPLSLSWRQRLLSQSELAALAPGGEDASFMAGAIQEGESDFENDEDEFF